MRLKTNTKQNDETFGEGKSCVQSYSRRASLVNEFCLDTQENNIVNVKAAEKPLRQTMGPSVFASRRLF